MPDEVTVGRTAPAVRRLSDADILRDACHKSWHAGYQTAVDTLREFASEFGDEQMKAGIAQLAEMLMQVKR